MEQNKLDAMILAIPASSFRDKLMAEVELLRDEIKTLKASKGSKSAAAVAVKSEPNPGTDVPAAD